MEAWAYFLPGICQNSLMTLELRCLGMGFREDKYPNICTVDGTLIYHCRFNLRRAGRNPLLNKCIGVLQNDRYHCNFLQVTAISHLASNIFFLQNSLDRSRPHHRSSKTLVWTPAFKNGKEKSTGVALHCIVFCTQKSSMALWGAGRERISLDPFQSIR